MLKHETKCKEWNDDVTILKNEITDIYNPECEALLREQLFTSEEFGQVVEFGKNNVIKRRGPGTKSNWYAKIIHQDFGKGR